MNWIAHIPEQILANRLERMEILGIAEMAGGAALMHRGHRLFMAAVHESHLNGTTKDHPSMPATGTGPAAAAPATTEGIMPKVNTRRLR